MKTISIFSLALLGEQTGHLSQTQAKPRKILNANPLDFGTAMPPISSGRTTPPLVGQPKLDMAELFGDFDIDFSEIQRMRDEMDGVGGERETDGQGEASQETGQGEQEQKQEEAPDETEETPNQTLQLTVASARKLPQIKQMVTHMTDLTLGQVSKIIRNYGCYCYVGKSKLPGTISGKGNIKPLDPLDEACRDLWRAEKCLAVDSENGVYGEKRHCSMKSGYKWHLDEANSIKCGDEDPEIREKKRQDGGKNGDEANCKMDLCELEKSFAIRVKKIFDNGFEKNNDFYKMSESDYNEKCSPPEKSDKDKSSRDAGDLAEEARNEELALAVVAGEAEDENNDQSELSFKPNDPALLACCGSGIDRRTYNTMIADCCNDGSVRPFGMC